jgi:hypothetical protein
VVTTLRAKNRVESRTVQILYRITNDNLRQNRWTLTT